MSSNDAPAPPNYRGLNRMARQQMRFSQNYMRQQMDWAKKTYADNKQITDKVVDSFLDQQRVNSKNAAADRKRYEQIFQPLEDSLANEAKSYATQERRDSEMGRAEAGVGQEFEAARVNAQRQLESFGINPGSTRFAALDIGVRAQEAASKAAAGNQAAERVDATGRALRSEAINVGRGYPGQIAGTYNTSMQAGNQAINGNLSQTASGANIMGTGAQWAGINNQTMQGYGNILNQNYANQMSQFNANQQGSGIGSLLGLAGSLGMKYMTGGAFADGGVVPDQVSPSRGKAIDDVPAQVTAGEFIVPKETVVFKGTEFFHKLISKSREAKAEIEEESGAIPTMHPGAMRHASPAARREALRVN